MPPLYAILVNDTSPFLSIHVGSTKRSVSLSINRSNDQVSQPINHSLDGFLRVPHYLGATLPIHLNTELLSTVVVLCSSNMVLLLSEVNQ